MPIFRLLPFAIGRVLMRVPLSNPELIAILKRIIDTANRQHVAAGCWFGKRRQVVRTIRQGARLVVYSNDSVMLKETIDSSFAEFRKG